MGELLGRNRLALSGGEFTNRRDLLRPLAGGLQCSRGFGGNEGPIHLGNRREEMLAWVGSTPGSGRQLAVIRNSAWAVALHTAGELLDLGWH